MALSTSNENGFRLRPDLGDSVQLGALYNARRDTFCDLSAFRYRIPDDSVLSNYHQSSTVRLSFSRSFSERARCIDMDLHLQLSILSGLVEPTGTARCFRASSNNVKRTYLVYQLTCYRESINLDDERLSRCLSSVNLQDERITHVVNEVTWGARVFISLETSNSEIDNQEFDMTLIQLQRAIERRTNGSKESFVGNEIRNGFEYRIDGDFFEEEISCTYLRVLDIIEQLPTILEEQAGEKGRPMFYMLASVTRFSGSDNVSRFSEIPDSVTLTAIEAFEEFLAIERDVEKLVYLTDRHSSYLPFKQIQEVKMFRKKFEDRKSCIYEKFRQELMIARRYCDESLSSADIQEECISFKNQLDEFNTIASKIKFAETLIHHGIVYIGAEMSLYDEFLKYPDKIMFVLFYKEETKNVESIKWHRNYDVLLQEAIKENNQCFIVDCDINPSIWPTIGMIIRVYKKGELIIEDYINTELHVHNQLQRMNCFNEALPRQQSEGSNVIDYGSFLFEAVRQDNVTALQGILELGVEIDKRDRDDLTPLVIGCISGSVEILKVLIASGANVNLLCRGEIPENSGIDGGWTPLMFACCRGHLDIVKCLIDSGASIRAKSKRFTPLSLAARNGYLEIVEFLLKHGVNVNSSSGDNTTALIDAALKNQLETVRCLIKNGASVNHHSKNGITALLVAAKKGHLEIVRLLIESYGDVSSQNSSKDTPVISAVRMGHFEVVRLLIRSNAPINDQNEMGQTSLTIASSRGFNEIAQFLINSGANLNHRNEFGFASLALSASKNHLYIVCLLINSGAEINDQQNPEGLTPLMLASSLGHKEIVKVLIEAQAKVGLRNSRSWTALMLASKYNKVEIVKLLLDAKANVWDKNDSGQNALDVAREYNSSEAVHLLESATRKWWWFL